MTPQTPPFAVIFDFDGVLFESEQFHCEALVQVLAEFGVDIDWAEYAERYVGLSDQEIFERLIERCPSLGQVDADEALRRKWRLYESLTSRGIAPIDGVGELVNRLRNDDIPMAICSGSRRSEIERLLEQASLASNFEAIVATEDVSASKPSPEGYLLALQRLRSRHAGLSAGQCIVFEDAAAGILAARSAGMRAVALRKSYGDVGQAEPHAHIAAFNDATADFLHGLIVAPSS